MTEPLAASSCWRETYVRAQCAAHPRGGHARCTRPYDRLIGAALEGNRLLFARQDTVEAAWRVVDPVLDDAVPVHRYPRGTWGPEEADALLPSGGTWHDPVA